MLDRDAHLLDQPHECGRVLRLRTWRCRWGLGALRRRRVAHTELSADVFDELDQVL
jgi:hypothetical protein